MCDAVQVANLIGEVKYKDFTQTGKLQDSVTLNELIKLYVNHRPVLGIGKGQIAEALSMVKRAVEGEEGDSLKWASMATVLTQEAEVSAFFPTFSHMVSLNEN